MRVARKSCPTLIIPSRRARRPRLTLFRLPGQHTHFLVDRGAVSRIDRRKSSLRISATSTDPSFRAARSVPESSGPSSPIQAYRFSSCQQNPRVHCRRSGFWIVGPARRCRGGARRVRHWTVRLEYARQLLVAKRGADRVRVCKASARHQQQSNSQQAFLCHLRRPQPFLPASWRRRSSTLKIRARGPMIAWFNLQLSCHVAATPKWESRQRHVSESDRNQWLRAPQPEEDVHSAFSNAAASTIWTSRSFLGVEAW